MIAHVSLFSKRNQAALISKKLIVSLSTRLRKRVCLLMEQYDSDMDDCKRSETTQELLRQYGTEQLTITKDNKTRTVNLDGFIHEGYPDKVLDVVEVFYKQFYKEDQSRDSFQKEFNQLMIEEKSCWLLCDGYFFKLDSEFLNNCVLQQTNELLAAHSYAGPLDEFNEARKDLVAGSNKDAIHKANKAFESVLKIIEQKVQAKPGALLHGIPETFFAGLPDKFIKEFPDKILTVLPFIRNEIGGHGQGKAVVKDEDCKHVANLAVNLAGCFIVFLIQRQLELNPDCNKHNNSI